MPITTFARDLAGDTLPKAGGHLTGPNLTAIIAALGATMDANAEQAFAGRLQAIPFCGGANAGRVGATRGSDGRLLECEPFVLPILAAQRGIRLWSTESVLSQRVRTASWLRLRASHGTDLGKMQNLQPWWLPGVLPTIRIFYQSNEATPTSTCHTLGPRGWPLDYSVTKSTPSAWNWDGQAAKCGRFWAVIHLPPGFSTTGSGWSWDDGTLWDGGPVWGGGGTAAMYSDWIGMLIEAKGASSRLTGVFVTDLQPTDDIPGHPGRHPFDPTDVAFTDAAGWTSLPTGSWGSATYASGPHIGAGTRFPYAELIYLDATP